MFTTHHITCDHSMINVFCVIGHIKTSKGPIMSIKVEKYAIVGKKWSVDRAGTSAFSLRYFANPFWRILGG